MGTLSVIEARRYRRVGQAAAAVLAVSAASLWAFRVPMFSPALPPPPEPPAAPVPQATGGDAEPAGVGRQALAATANRLEIGANVKKPAAPQPETAKAEPAAPTGPEWLYLGDIREPGRRLALVSVDGHQRILAEGRSYGDTRLVLVEGGEIVLRDRAGERRIARSERSETSPRVAWVRDMPTNLPAANAAMTPATATAVALQRQQIERARQRGYRTFQEREMERRNRGRGGNFGPRG